MLKSSHFFLAFIILSLALGPSIASAQEETITTTFSTAAADSMQEVNNSDWALILNRYISIGPSGISRFNYAAVTTTDRDRLNRYVSSLENLDPRKLNLNEQHAYWINLYNSLTVQVVLDHYPIWSIREIKSGVFTPGPWDIPIAKITGRTLTLNNIEHDILRANWHDPRVHYALNCASLGCPNLAAEPYSGKHLDAQLNSAARSFINHPRAVLVKGGQVTLSKIYNWYASDFGNGSHEAILEHLRHYANPALEVELKRDPIIKAYQYDWRLNAPGLLFSLSD